MQRISGNLDVSIYIKRLACITHTSEMVTKASWGVTVLVTRARFIWANWLGGNDVNRPTKWEMTLMAGQLC